MVEEGGNITYAPKIWPVNFARMSQERAARAQAIIKKNKVAAALLFRPENIVYATGNFPLFFIDRLAYAMVFAEHDTMMYLPETMFNIPYAGWQMPAMKPENLRIARYWANQTPGPEATREKAKQWASEIKADLKQKGLPWEKAKAFDGSCPLSAFVPIGSFEALDDIKLQLTVNNTVRQQGSSRNMLTDIVSLIEYISHWFTLDPGDVVLTGTPEGVGPLHPDDELGIELIGHLTVQTTVQP